MDNKQLGRKLKVERLNKSLTIKDLAIKVGVTSSLLSQIERGLASPSLNTLRSITKALDIPLFSLFLPEQTLEARVKVVRKEERIRIHEGHYEEDNAALSYDLLTPDLKGTIQLCEMVLAPNEMNTSILQTHDAEEVAICVEGEMTLVVFETTITLKVGDSVRIEKNTPHQWRNHFNGTSKLIFAVSPPIF